MTLVTRNDIYNAQKAASVRRTTIFKRIAGAAFGTLISVSVATAQEAPPVIVLPGSVNASFGSVGPLEPGNVLGNVTVEQGVTVWRRGPLFVMGFVDLTMRADTQGLAWNNTLPHVSGAKVVLSGHAGVLQAVVGVAGDLRRETPAGTRPAGYVSYWSGWYRSAGEVQLPGSMWATSGVTTASEPDNWITAARVEQGVTVKRIGRLSVVPFAAVSATTDTRDYGWNNRGSLDAGVKLQARIGGAAVDLGVAERITRGWRSRESDAAPVVFVNVWLGWMPRLTR